MKKYSKPEVSIVEFEKDDVVMVVTTSFEASHEGFEDGYVVKW